MRKLTADYFVKQIIKSQTPTEFLRASTNLVLFWVDHLSYQYRESIQQNKY